MRELLTHYSLRYIPTLLYMLQASEYQPRDYMAWLRRTRNFSNVAKRRNLDYTTKAKLLAIAMWGIAALSIGLFGWMIYSGIDEGSYRTFIIGILGLLLLPWLLAYAVLVPLVSGRLLIQIPRERSLIAAARKKLNNHKGYKIAIAGSYGKTTAKEILKTVLSEGKKVAATPGNMNTPIGISRFVMKLDGDEDILIFELGEARVGDVRQLCDLTMPDAGVITGISEAHLETFGTIDNIVSTIFELQDSLGDKPLYANADNELINKRATDKAIKFSNKKAGEWHVKKASSSIEGTEFTIAKGSRELTIHAGLLGEHNVGIMAATVAIADEFGLSDEQIIKGFSQVVPFEHRMQPRKLHGAWIIDDTYNGNSEGMRVGLELLKELSAKRRLYVTPGLVEQGDETAAIHHRIGGMIADSADVTFLMKNSVTDYIVEGLESSGYKGELRIIDDPLDFYQNIDQFIAAGDVVLMQNDWTDNYA